MKIGNLKIGTHLGIGFGLVIVMMLITKMRFATEGEINSRIIDKDWVEAEAPNVVNATTSGNAQCTMEPVIATDKSQVAKATERIEANNKTINEVLATLDKLIDRPEGLGIAPTANSRAS